MTNLNNKNNIDNNSNNSIDQLLLNVEISDLIQDIQTRTIALINLKSIWNIWKKIREDLEFEKSQIEADGAIKDINSLLEKYKYNIQDESFLREYSKLASWNTCNNVWNDWFEVYTRFLNEVWVEISKEELKKIAWKKTETTIKASPNYYSKAI